MVADVTDPAAIEAAVAAAVVDGALAGLVYAVGTINLKPIGALTAVDFERDWRVNALGAALAMKAAAPALKQVEGASAVLFSTVAVRQGFAAHASVSMAKGAVEGLTLALAAELAPKIRVNCIAPSLTRTPSPKRSPATKRWPRVSPRPMRCAVSARPTTSRGSRLSCSDPTAPGSPDR